jgi:DNA-binding transcriptional LysR family regulator
MAEEVEAEMRSVPIRRPLHLGSMESTAGSRLPRLLGGLHRRWPYIAIELQTGTTATLIRKVADYELEAAFVAEPFSAPGMRSRVAFEEELVVVTSKSHPA